MPRFNNLLPLAAAVALCLLPVLLQGQGLAGQLVILEKDGVRTPDLAEAVLWLEPTAAVAPGVRQSGQITMKGKQFVPRVQVVTAGSVVDYPNDDPFRHNVFSKSGPAEFDLGLYARGDSRQMAFARAGVYPIFCNIHAKMVAYVVAVPSAYSVRPGADGRFVLAGVPAGSYTLKVWHERGGQLSRPVTVPVADGTALALQLDARSYRLTQHKNKFGANYTTSGSERY
jgi:plastocyanin